MKRDKCVNCSYKCDSCDTIYPNSSKTKTDSLCWCCARVINTDGIDLCPWHNNKEPIPEWKVRVRKHKDGSRGVFVIECPMFIRG